MSEAPRVSLIVEWANVRLNGVLRAHVVLAELARQWQEIGRRAYPDDLPRAFGSFLEGLDRRAELLVVSGEPIDAEQEKAIRECPGQDFDLEIRVEPGAEYYPLKNLGAEQATGDLLVFIDSDVLPDPGWLAHLLGSFTREDLSVVSGQTYVGPVGLLGKTFALGWVYPLRIPGGGFRERKFSGNNVAFRAEVFRGAGGFPSLGPATRGAARRTRAVLAKMHVRTWQNNHAAVDHPPPTGVRHIVVRGLAHGRDWYHMEPTRLAGLSRSQRAAMKRLGRAIRRVFAERSEVGLRLYELPAALAFIGLYYGCAALGGILMHVRPEMMARRFRV